MLKKSIVITAVLLISINYAGNNDLGKVLSSDSYNSRFLIHDQNDSQISIDGNEDFLKQAIDRGWDFNNTRDGSFLKPYLLNGLELTSLIRIYNTNIHFLLEKWSYIGTGQAVVSFFEVSNAKIVNNTFQDGTVGFGNCENIFIENNTLSSKNPVKHSLHGIYLSNSNNITVKNNTVYGRKNGIELHNTNTSKIISNQVFNNTNIGVWLEKSNYNLIFNNTINNNGLYGLRVSDSKDNSIYDNTIYDNAEANIYWPDRPITGWVFSISLLSLFILISIKRKGILERFQ